MKKIIAAFDGLKYSQSTRDFAIYLSKKTDTHLVGIFLDDPTYSSYKIYDLVTKEGISDEKIRKFKAEDVALRKTSADDFEKACIKSGLEYSLHHDHNISKIDIKHECIYTDLMIIDSKETLTHYTEKLPTRFIRDLLSDVQCPVLLVPQKYKPIEKIILLYDGEPSSVQAIKMFSYLLPQLKEIETEVISVNAPTSTLHLPDNKLMKEFMKRHFPKAKFNVIRGWAEEEIIKYLKKTTENTLVVLGAYRRGSISRLFRQSMADILMKEVKFPLFIAHNI
jgi:hypothetical protein